MDARWSPGGRRSPGLPARQLRIGAATERETKAEDLVAGASARRPSRTLIVPRSGRRCGTRNSRPRRDRVLQVAAALSLPLESSLSHRSWPSAKLGAGPRRRRRSRWYGVLPGLALDDRVATAGRDEAEDLVAVPSGETAFFVNTIVPALSTLAETCSFTTSPGPSTKVAVRVVNITAGVVVVAFDRAEREVGGVLDDVVGPGGQMVYSPVRPLMIAWPPQGETKPKTGPLGAWGETAFVNMIVPCSGRRW